MYIWIVFAIFLWSYANGQKPEISCPLIKTFASQCIAEYPNRIDDTILQDLVIQGHNYIIIGSETSSACTNATCERYSLPNLRQRLTVRGDKRYHDNFKTVNSHTLPSAERIKNAGSSYDDVYIADIRSSMKNQVDTIRLMRELNMHSYILMLVHLEDDFGGLKKFILKEEIFNIYLFTESRNPEVYFLYENCAYCDTGKHLIKLVNIWELGRGFTHPLRYAPSFKGDFNNADLNIGLNIIPPTIFPVGRTPDNKIVYAGSEYFFLEALAKALKFTPVLIRPNDDLACMQVNSSGQYKLVGWCLLLQEKIVTFAGFPGFLDIRTEEIFHQTQPYYYVDSIIVSARQQIKNTGMAPSKVLKSSLVLPILASLLGICVCLWVIQKLELGADDTFVGLMLEVIASLFLEALVLRNLNDPKRIILGVWMICAFLVISLVFGEITAMTTMPNTAGLTINTIEDMKKYDYSWVSMALYNYDAILKEKLPEQAKRSKKISSLEDALTFILDNPTEYVLIIPQEGVEPLIRIGFWDGKSENPFHFSPPIDGAKTNALSVFQSKDSPHRKTVDIKILHLTEAGLYNFKFKPDTLEILSRSYKAKPGEAESKSMDGGQVEFSIKHLQPSCVFILGVWFVTIIVFLIELFFPSLYEVVSPIRNLPIPIPPSKAIIIV